MSRPARAALITLAMLLAVGLASLYPVLMRGEAWLSANWLSRWWLLGLATVPFVVYRTTLGADARAPRLALPTIAALTLGPRGWRSKIRDLPGVLRGAALVLGVLALGRPQNVLKGETAEERGIDIVIVLDLS